MNVRSSEGEQQESEWVLDTGIGLDVAGGGIDGARVTDARDAPELMTGGGLLQPAKVVETYLDECGQNITALQLPQDAPKALTIGRRCASEGF